MNPDLLPEPATWRALLVATATVPSDDLLLDIGPRRARNYTVGQILQRPPWVPPGPEWAHFHDEATHNVTQPRRPLRTITLLAVTEEWPTHPARQRLSDAPGRYPVLLLRDLDAVYARAHGDTLEAIAQRNDVTRECIRVGLVHLGNDTGINIRAVTQQHFTDVTHTTTHANRAQLLAFLRDHPGITLNDLAAHLNTNPHIAHELLPPYFRRFLAPRPAHAPRFVSPTQRDDILQALRTAANRITNGGYISGLEYDDAIRGGVANAPLNGRVKVIFGSWGEACRQAGIPTPIPRPHRRRQWSPDDVATILLTYILDPTNPNPTLDGYTVWRTSRPTQHLPSASLLRIQYGGWGNLTASVFTTAQPGGINRDRYLHAFNTNTPRSHHEPDPEPGTDPAPFPTNTDWPSLNPTTPSPGVQLWARQDNQGAS